jgi:hypothetical protein
VNELHESIVRAAVCVTSRVLTNSRQETEYSIEVNCFRNGARMRSVEHRRNLGKSSVSKCISFSHTFSDQSYIISILFSFRATYLVFLNL